MVNANETSPALAVFISPADQLYIAETNSQCAQLRHVAVLTLNDSPEENAAYASLFAASRRLLALARQYASDCQTRIRCIQDELSEVGTSEKEQRQLLEDGDDDADEDRLDQIDHWRATQRGVDAIIAKAEGRTT